MTDMQELAPRDMRSFNGKKWEDCLVFPAVRIRSLVIFLQCKYLTYACHVSRLCKPSIVSTHQHHASVLVGSLLSLSCPGISSVILRIRKLLWRPPLVTSCLSFSFECHNRRPVALKGCVKDLSLELAMRRLRGFSCMIKL